MNYQLAIMTIRYTEKYTSDNYDTITIGSNFAVSDIIVQNNSFPSIVIPSGMDGMFKSYYTKRLREHLASFINDKSYELNTYFYVIVDIGDRIREF